jgi:hypothetical protein
MAIVEDAKRNSGEPDIEAEGDVRQDVLDWVKEDGKDMDSGVDIANNRRSTHWRKGLVGVETLSSNCGSKFPRCVKHFPIIFWRKLHALGM